jgi:predicted transposase/invertase (TIGR01784 family)
MKINRKNDYAFKHIFGRDDNKDILARFLFEIFQWRDPQKFHGLFRVLEQDELVLFSDALEIHILELPKLLRHAAKANWLPEECWGMYLNNTEGELMEQLAAREPMLQRALTVEDIFMKNDEERRLYELREKGRHEYTSALNDSEKKESQKGGRKGWNKRRKTC